MERISTGICGSLARIILRSSSPSRPGSEMSTMARSGRRFSTASSAVWDSSAAAQTVKSGSRLMSSVMPSRTIGWSSTTSTLRLAAHESMGIDIDQVTSIRYSPLTLTLRRNGKIARYSCALSVRPDHYSPANHFGAMFHDVKAHAGALRRPGCDSTAIVPHNEDTRCAPVPEMDINVPGLAMRDPVAHGFLRDVIKMAGYCSVADQQRLVRIEPAGDPEHFFHFVSHLFQAGHQAVGLGQARHQATRQLTRFVNRFVHQAHDLGCLRSFGRAFFREALLLHLAHKSDPGKQLPQTVVKILPDPALF